MQNSSKRPWFTRLLVLFTLLALVNLSSAQESTDEPAPTPQQTTSVPVTPDTTTEIPSPQETVTEVTTQAPIEEETTITEPPPTTATETSEPQTQEPEVTETSQPTTQPSDTPPDPETTVESTPVTEEPITSTPGAETTAEVTTEPTTPPEMTDEASNSTPEVTEVTESTPEVEVTAVVELTPEVEVTAELTPEVTETFEPELTPTAEVTAEATAEMDIGALGETACAMDINDGGDSNPFTYGFAAVNASGIDSFDWTFGDGATDTGGIVSHTYGNTGTYTVTLTCVPTVGDDLILTGSITIASIPVASFSITPGTTGTSPYTVYIVNQSTGGGLTYSWQVEKDSSIIDTSTDAEPSFTFNSPGTYTISLLVTDGAGQTASFSADVIVVEEGPRADFTISPASGTTADTFVITGVDLGGGTIDSWEFSLSDGQTFSGQGPHNVTFATNGTYDVHLDYSGPGGFGTVDKQVGVFPAEDTVDAIFSYEIMGSGMIVCFNNLSEGPVTSSEWDFGDGTIVTDNSSRVCHSYSGGDRNFTVTLRVEGSSASVFSTATQTIFVTAAPLAQITVTSNSIAWGETVDFSSANSTGIITDWEWDFNSDGTIDSTDPNPGGIAFTNLGSNPVTLTVTGPGGSSTAQVIIMVAQAQISCDISGSFSALVGETSSFSADVSGLNGRDVTYNWTLTGNGVNASGSADSISQAWSQTGSYLLVLEATADNGASCSSTKTIQVNYPALACSLSGDFTNVVPNGSAYDYSVSVTGDSGRVLNYSWTINSAAQGETGNTLSRAWSEGNYDISVTVSTADGSDSCTDSGTVAAEWSELICSIDGSFGVIPLTAQSYSANVSGSDGSSLTYDWVITFADTSTQTSSTSSIDVASMPEGVHSVQLQVNTSDGRSCSGGAASATITAEWPTLTCSINGDDNPPYAIPSNTPPTSNYSADVSNTNGDASPDYQWYLDGNPVGTGSGWSRDWVEGDIGGHTLRLEVTTDGADGGQNCASEMSIDVDLQGLTCSNLPPVSATYPASGVMYSYGTPSIGNAYNRSISFAWSLEENISGSWVEIDSDTNGNFDFVLPENNKTYRVTYTATASDPTDSCTKSRTLETTGIGFTCQSWSNAPASLPSGSANFSVVIANPSNSSLNATWTITRPDGSTATFSDSTSNATGYSRSFSTGDFGSQIGSYGYSLSLTDGSYTCSFGGRSLLLGQLNVDFTSSVDNTAVGVGEEICLTNTTSVSPGSMNDVDFSWDLANGTTSTDQTPGCFSYDAPGTYTVTVDGSANGYNDSASMEFTVYGQQSIAMDYNGGERAPTNYTFTAIGTNITGNYRWTFYNASNNVIGTRNGQTVNYFFNAAGTYTAVVEGDGNLGTTSASATFTLLNVNDIRAAFTPSTYGALAPLHVCFTDRSSGPGISSWSWDFGNGETLNYTSGNIPSSVCTDYTQDGQQFDVRLTVSDGSLNAQANNVVRTYNLLESSSSFSVEPQGNGVYCFTASVGATTDVTSWDFGDGTPPLPVTDNDQVCHTYLISGTYLVGMNVSEGGETGKVERPIIVEVTAPPSVPDIQVGASCLAGPAATFTVRNDGDDMTTPDRLTIADADGNVVLTDDYFQLDAGDSTTYTINNYSGELTLRTLDTGVSAQTDCPDAPTIRVESLCRNDWPYFAVRNGGGDMPSEDEYTVTNSGGEVIATDTFLLLAGESFELSLPNQEGRFTFSSTAGLSAVSADCLAETSSYEVLPTAVPTEEAEATEEPETASYRSSSAFDGIAEEAFTLPGWETVPTCSSRCVPWRVYHTNHTGDWEIFRLDGADPISRTTSHQNLSQGVGEDVADMAPSRSPNGEWVIFSSNRDGNWELYVAPTDGDGSQIQRVTRNSIAIDTDPVWGPHQYVAFETTRDGNWELYLLDMLTGREIRLTDHPGSDINPSWSPDGSKLAFQSDREGMWQIYEIDLTTLTMVKLSDGSGVDVEPMYNFTGDQIAFRSYRDETGNSVIYLMDADGGNPQAITSPDEDATNHSWSPLDTLIAYQSDKDGDLDVYIYELPTGKTRQLTDNAIADYSPTWMCDGTQVLFTSDVAGNPDIYEANALPIVEPGIVVNEEAEQLTFEPEDDIYPENTPGEENASREGQTIIGEYGEQTTFLMPDTNVTEVDLSIELGESSWMEVESCTVSRTTQVTSTESE